MTTTDETNLAYEAASSEAGTVNVPAGAGFWRTWLAFLGPGLMIAVGYMDPGNWATDLDGGSRFGYTLLSVVLMSNLMAVLLQHLALKLGAATGLDLAQACRRHYSKPTNVVLWVFCEIAIAACDLAEVIGSAIALNLLFKLPLVAGVIVTSADVLLILLLQSRGFRYLEAFVAALVFTVLACFGYQMIMARPEVAAIFGGLLPRPSIVFNAGQLYVAIGILGATVMPHNLYLHSSLIQTRKYPRDDDGRALAIKYGTIDSTASLSLAFLINAAILILAAATFHRQGKAVESIQQAHELLTPLVGTTLASTLFAVALLASGQNSTLTGTLAGQICMEGFLDVRLRPWLRRLVTRSLAVVPAAIVAICYGEGGIDKLLVLSQVVLSMQLSFAVFPLVQFTSSRTTMGRFVNARWLKILSWTVAVAIAGLNATLLVLMALGKD